MANRCATLAIIISGLRQQTRRAPAIDQRMMRGPHQIVRAIGTREQIEPRERCARKIEAAREIVVHPRGESRFVRRLIFFTHAMQAERQFDIALDDLPRGVVAPFEARAQDIVPRNGANVTGEILAAHCRNDLADYKVPAAFHFLTAFPLGATGKVDKRALKALHPEEEP